MSGGGFGSKFSPVKILWKGGRVVDKNYKIHSFWVNRLEIRIDVTYPKINLLRGLRGEIWQITPHFDLENPYF